MRIVYYSDNFYPELSGITDTLITTGKQLRERGHQVLYVAPYYAPADYAKAGRTYPTRPEDDAIDGIRVVRIPSVPMRPSPTGQSRFAFPTGASLKAVRAFGPDVVHTNSPYTTGLEARKVARALGVPLVGTNHTAIEDFFPFGLRTLLRRWDAHYYNHCQFVSAPYGALIARMREVGFVQHGEPVANPADLHEFKPPEGAERAQAREAHGLHGPTVLYAGRLGVEKRVDVLVRAVALLAQDFPTLTLLMTGHGAARPTLERLARTLDIEKHIRFAGFVDRAELPNVYKAADVFAMASTSDSQSLALMQAYSTGLPAVCARARGLPDYTPSDVGFLAEPGSAEQFAAHLRTLLNDSALRGRMGARARQFVHDFEPGVIAARWESIYRDVLASFSAAKNLSRK